MEWISVKEGQPEKGQQVLVRGWLGTDLTERDEEVDVTIGLVNWDSPNYSECSDTCYYSMWYSGITHWSPVVFELEAEQEVSND
jgi:hypothetical protein